MAEPTKHSAPLAFVTHTRDQCGVEAGTPHPCVYLPTSLGPVHPILFADSWVLNPLMTADKADDE